MSRKQPSMTFNMSFKCLKHPLLEGRSHHKAAQNDKVLQLVYVCVRVHTTT